MEGEENGFGGKLTPSNYHFIIQNYISTFAPKDSSLKMISTFLLTT